MWNARTFLKPSTILAIGTGLQLLFYMLFEAAILQTFRLQRQTIPIIGQLHLLAFYFIAVGMLMVFEKIRIPNMNVSPRWKQFGRKMLPGMIIIVLLIMGTYGLWNVLEEVPLHPSLARNMLLGIQGYFRPMIPWGRGFTILHVALQVAIILSMIFIRRPLLKLLIITVLIGMLVIYSTIYMSRIMLLAPLVAIFVLVVRKKYYLRRISFRLFLLVIILFFILVVLQQGIRDYNVVGQQYTDSVIFWGLSRVTEYFISTAAFSAYIGGLLESSYISPGICFGTPEYVNVGSLGQLWNSFGVIYPFVLLFFWWLVTRYWQKFDKGYLDGFIVYPFLVYSLFEFSRIFEFTTVTGLIRLILLIACGWLLRNIPIKRKANEDTVQ